MKVVEFETAVELKNVGFDVKVLRWFFTKGSKNTNISMEHPITGLNWNQCVSKKRISAPYQYEVMDWLRNQHNIHISPYPSDNVNKEWYCEIEDLWLTNGFNTKTRSYFKSLEGALEAGILEAIKNIK